MSYIIPKIHREGYFFISIFAIVSVIFANIVMVLGIIGFVLTIWCVYFFRDPERVTPDNDNLVISPADGVIQKIVYVVPPSELELGDEEMLRISVFLSVFNVHVNRSAVTGIVRKLYYHPGKFLNASLDKASEDNERQSVVVETNHDVKVAFVQIAGLIARRIVCDLHEGDQLKAGQRFGIIRFGSRMDVYLPKNISPLVFEGQIAVAGETIFADLTNSYPVNICEIR